MKIWIAVVFSLLLLVAAAASGQPTKIWIVNNTSLPDCPEIQGTYVGFLIPEQGVLLLSTERFPGSHQIGELRGNIASFSVDPLGLYELETALYYEVPMTLWGSLDRVLDPGNRTGCIAFDKARFTDIDDLRTYVLWILDKYAEFTPPEGTGGWALRMSDRVVTLEVTPQGYGTAEIRVKEGGLTELRLGGQDAVYAFLPVIFDEATGRVGVRVYRVDPGEQGEKDLQELEIAQATYESPAFTSTDPSFEIRVGGIE